MENISDEEFDRFSRLIHDRFGINLTEQKRGLLVARLQKIMRKNDFSSFTEFFERMEKDASGVLVNDLVNRISTNHTFFYREKEHFEYFRNVALDIIVDELEAKKTKDIRLWSAGCSSGEEPYMLVMMMMEKFGADYSRWNAGALGTDISKTALEDALRAVYPEEKMNYLPLSLRQKYMRKINKEEWEINPEVRKEVVFRRLNLMGAEFPFKKPFHAIFCRNVLIYFDVETKFALIEKFRRYLVDGGFLFIGHSESLGAAKKDFEFVRPALYRKR
jgi:chemotaxis protein methyltransferase CheR